MVWPVSSHKWKSAIRLQFVTLETLGETLGVWGMGKNWAIADGHVPSNDPRNNCGRIWAPISLAS